MHGPAHAGGKSVFDDTLHGREHVLGKFALLDVAQMQFQELIVVRGIGKREAAVAAVGQNKIDILAGQELEALGARQFEMETYQAGSFLTCISAAAFGSRTSMTMSPRGRA